jgi:hypothetical protein
VQYSLLLLLLLPNVCILQVVHGTMNVPTSAVTLKGPDGMTSVAQGTGTGAKCTSWFVAF